MRPDAWLRRISDDLKSIVASATSRVEFIARDIDVDFVNRYLPSVPPTVRVSLLVGRKNVATLLPAANAYAEKNGTQIYVSSCADDEFTCGFVVIDDHAQYYCGGHSLVESLLSHEKDPMYLIGAMQAVSKLEGASREERVGIVGKL